MSRNYDNWERLVAAVVKREQIWQLCHQLDSESSSSTSSSADLELSSFPVSLGSIIESFEFWSTDMVRLSQQLQEHFGRGSKAVIKSVDSNVTHDVTEKEFEQRMTFIGNCRHENVGVPWGYYYSYTTKLLAYDYNSQGSLFDMLRDKGSRPDWEGRMRLAVGAAWGIAHIHAQCGGKLFHGNINSSTIFLNRKQYGCVSDFGMGRPRNHEQSQKSDVYSFGLVLLELVTPPNESPMRASCYIVDHLRKFEPNEGYLECFKPGSLYVDELDLMERSEGRFVFEFVDPKLTNDSSVHHELVKTLSVAKSCLAELQEDRPTMSDVASMLCKKHSTPDLSMSAQIYNHEKTDCEQPSQSWIHSFCLH